MVVSNLWNAGAKGGDGHYCKEAAFLTCATIKKTQGADVAGGFFQARQIAPHQDGIRARIGDGERHLAPQAATTARDEQAPAVKAKTIEDAHGMFPQHAPV